MIMDHVINRSARAMARADGNRWPSDPIEGAFPPPMAVPSWWRRMAQIALETAEEAETEPSPEGEEEREALLEQLHLAARDGSFADILAVRNELADHDIRAGRR